MGLSMTVTQLRERFLANYSFRDRKVRSNYQRHLLLFEATPDPEPSPGFMWAEHSRTIGELPVDSLSRKHMKAFLNRMAELEYTVKTCRDRRACVLLMIDWGVDLEMVSEDTLVKLQKVKALRVGQSNAKPPKPLSIPDRTDVSNVLAFLPNHGWLQAIIGTIRYTGMRVGEAASMDRSHIFHDDGAALSMCRATADHARWTALSREDKERLPGPTLLYLPEHHKSAAKGRARPIFIGPRAQIYLLPWLDSHHGEWVFPGRHGGKHITAGAITQNFIKWIERENQTRFTPKGLRKLVAKEIRDQINKDVAKAVLGHADSKVTEQHYAGIHDRRAAQDAMARFG